MRKLALLPLAAALALAGCAKDNYMYFGTNTNIGVDVNTVPSNISIGHERLEAIIAPAWDGGKVASALATIDNNPLRFKVDQTYATGKVAETIARRTGEDSGTDVPSTDLERKVDALFNQLENHENLDHRIPDGYTPEFKRYAFVTNTAIGLNATHPQTGGSASASIGYKRQELSAIPVSPPKSATSSPEAPSLFATIGASAEKFFERAAGAIPGNEGDNNDGDAIADDVKISQVFAVGRAAELLVENDDLREAAEAALFGDSITLGTPVQQTIERTTRKVRGLDSAKQDQIADATAAALPSEFRESYDTHKGNGITKLKALGLAKDDWLSDERENNNGKGTRHDQYAEAFDKAYKQHGGK